MARPTDRPPPSDDLSEVPSRIPIEDVVERKNGNGHAGEVFKGNLLSVLLRFKSGDFSSRMPAEMTGIDGKIADTFNDILMVSERRATEIARVCRVVGRE